MAVQSCDPMSGQLVFTAAESTPAEVDSAVATASSAWQSWAAASCDRRAEVLRRFADLLERHEEQLADLITREVGKRSVDALGEVQWTALSARWYADNPPEERVIEGATILRAPLGVIAAITPWNVPLVTPAWKWLPALMAGNAVLWKPSELATGIATEVGVLFAEAGLPAGVLQIVAGGPEVARQLCLDSRVGGIHFTGSTRAGRAISELTAPRFARTALEMGGSNPAVVFEDADISVAAEAIVASGTALAGQKCTAIRRVLVHSAIADELGDALGERLGALRVGPPDSSEVDVGPLVSSRARETADRVVEGAVARGATVLARTPLGPGARGPTFFAPVLLGGLAHNDPLTSEEVFAPILVIEEFTDSSDVFSVANSTGYGLCGAVYTQDRSKVEEARRRLRVGVLAINGRSDAVGLEQPFGGRGLSGNGHPEGGAFVYSAVTDMVAVYETATTQPLD